MRRLNAQGFTLPELMAVAVIVLAGLFIATALLRPVDFSLKQQEAVQRTDLAAIAQAMRRYKSATGNLPEGLPDRPTLIGSEQGDYNLCRYLVPAYLSDIPLDRTFGQRTANRSCGIKGMHYEAGYMIQRNKNGQATVSSPAASSSHITITVP